MLSVDESIASELGIESVSNAKGEIGGSSADISFGKTDSLKLGEVDILNIPVMLIPFDGFENEFGDATNVHAVIGTNVLQRFIPTIDYPSGQLILVPRDESGHKQINAMLADENILEKIPFTLSSTHYMFSKGSINGYAGLTMFVDSGHVDDEGSGILLSKETMDILGIPMPELEQAAKGKGGLGGDDYEVYRFDLTSYGLSNLQLKAGIGDYDYGTSNFLSSFIDDFGFVSDAMIRHNYLKRYKWTIDFYSMTMTFSK